MQMLWWLLDSEIINMTLIITSNTARTYSWMTSALCYTKTDNVQAHIASCKFQYSVGFWEFGFKVSIKKLKVGMFNNKH